MRVMTFCVISHHCPLDQFPSNWSFRSMIQFLTVLLIIIIFTTSPYVLLETYHNHDINNPKTCVCFSCKMDCYCDVAKVQLSVIGCDQQIHLATWYNIRDVDNILSKKSKPWHMQVYHHHLLLYS